MVSLYGLIYAVDDGAEDFVDERIGVSEAKAVSSDEEFNLVAGEEEGRAEAEFELGGGFDHFRGGNFEFVEESEIAIFVSSGDEFVGWGGECDSESTHDDREDVVSEVII